MNTKKLLSILLILSVLLSLCACRAVDTDDEDDEEEDERSELSEAELYDIGMDLIGTLDEMINSNEYASIMGMESISNVIEEVNSGDYSSPVAVYSIDMPKTEEILEIYGLDDNELWNGLSKELKDQVKNRFSFASIISMINSRYGSDKMAFSVSYTASTKVEKLVSDESKIYLYVFEDGAPVAVIFSEYKVVSAQFVFIENADELSEMKDFFEDFNCEIKEIKIKD